MPSLRGHYDRTLTPPERWLRARHALLRAAAGLAAEGPVTVGALVARAQVSRSTLYAQFRDVDALLDAVARRFALHAETEARLALADAATPVDALRALGRAAAAAAQPTPPSPDRAALARAALGAPPGRRALAVEPWRAALDDIARDARSTGALRADLAAAHHAVALDALIACVRPPWPPAPADDPAPPGAAAALAADALVRWLR